MPVGRSWPARRPPESLLVHILRGLVVHLSSMRAGWLRPSAMRFSIVMRPISRRTGLEARDGHALRRVVDDQIRAGDLLEGADVAAFAADDAALQVVARQVDRGHRASAVREARRCMARLRISRDLRSACLSSQCGSPDSRMMTAGLMRHVERSVSSSSVFWPRRRSCRAETSQALTVLSGAVFHLAALAVQALRFRLQVVVAAVQLALQARQLMASRFGPALRLLSDCSRWLMRSSAERDLSKRSCPRPRCIPFFIFRISSFASTNFSRCIVSACTLASASEAGRPLRQFSWRVAPASRAMSMPWRAR